MRAGGVVLLAWWLYVNTFLLVPAYPYAHVVAAWRWTPRERFLHREFCELNARQLRREGLEAACRYVDD